MGTQGNAAAWAEWHLVQSCQRHLLLTEGLQIFGILLSFCHPVILLAATVKTKTVMQGCLNKWQ